MAMSNNSYGLKFISRSCKRNGIQYFGVANALKEALEIRKYDSTLNILLTEYHSL